jgi:hypothetical protein
VAVTPSGAAPTPYVDAGLGGAELVVGGGRFAVRRSRFPEGRWWAAAALVSVGPEQAAFRRRWATERRRDYDELQTYLDSLAHIAAADQTRAAMMDVFVRRLGQ